MENERKDISRGSCRRQTRFPPPPQPNTDCYVSIRWNNRVWQLRREKMDGSNWKELTSCSARPHSTARTKNIFSEMKLRATPRIIRRVTVYIITHSGHLLMFLFHGGRARPKKKKRESSLSVLPSSASLSLTHSLNLFGEHRSCVNEANEQVVGAHITQEHELRETLDTMTRT